MSNANGSSQLQDFKTMWLAGTRELNRVTVVGRREQHKGRVLSKELERHLQFDRGLADGLARVSGFVTNVGAKAELDELRARLDDLRKSAQRILDDPLREVSHG